MRPASLFLPILLFSPTLAAQRPPQRDPQAVAVLAQMSAATGWNRATIPADVMATGKVTRYRGDTQDTMGIMLKANGPLQLRTELQAPSSPTVTIVNDYTAAVSTPKGTRWVPSHAAVSIRPRVFPFFSDVVAVTDANVSLLYEGTETINGQLAHRVEISREPVAGDPLAPLRRRADRLTVWISASTYLPVQIQYPRIGEDNATAVLTYVRRYSNYAVIQGMAMPLRQEEFYGMTRLLTLELTQVSFNLGLPPTDFVIPEPTQ